jgi:hypothetical protein
VNSVFNSSSFVYVTLTNDTGYVLDFGKTRLKELLKLLTCPAAVYVASNFLIYNDNVSCHLHNLKSGKLSMKLNHKIFGFDFRTESYIFKVADGTHVCLNCSKFKRYNNLSLNSVTSLPISWVSVISSHSLVLGTTIRRVMYVYNGIIKSHLRLPHSIEHISPTSDIQIRVTGSCVSTDLSVPVLGLVRLPESETEALSSAMKQLVVSCDNHIRKQLTGLNKLHRRHENKVEFLVDIWNKLFELTDVSGREQNVASDHTTKKRKIECPANDLSRFHVKQLPYQIPILPNLSTVVSLFLESDRAVTAHCSDASKPLLGIFDDFPYDISATLSRNPQFISTYNIKLTPEFKEKLRRMFAEALVSGKSGLMTDTLAHLANMILAIDNK